MVKAEVGSGRGVEVIAFGSALEMVGDVLNIVQAIHGDMSRLSYGERKAEFFRKALIAGLSPDSPVWRPCQGDVTSVVASGDAAELLARAFEGGISMTAIDLTRDQCAALADYLKKRVELCHQGYDLIELLVLAQRALRNASKGTVDIGLKGAPGAESRNEPKSGTPEGGGDGERCAWSCAGPALRCVGGGPIQAGDGRPAGGLPLQVGPRLHGPSGGPVRRRRGRRQADPDV